MIEGHDLFTYPHTAGWTEPTTSKDAAQSIDAGTLRAIVIDALERFGPMTADECAERLRMDRLSIRPRFTELKVMGLVRENGQRHRNKSGRMAKVIEIQPGEKH